MYKRYVFISLEMQLLTLGAHAPEGYGSCPVCVCVSVCVCVCVCLSATLIWGLGLVEVYTKAPVSRAAHFTQNLNSVFSKTASLES